MTKIVDYYAEVGVGVDKKSLGKVEKLLDSIESRLAKFQKRAAKISISPSVLHRSKFQKQLSDMGKNLTLNIGSVKIPRAAVNAALKGSPFTINATLSQGSLNRIRAQLGQTINLKVNPQSSRPRSGGGGGRGGTPTSHTTQSPHGKRNFNPWHNPMMVGGGVGAFLRYGYYSLPFVAGAMGLNTMANAASRLEGQRLQLAVGTGSNQAGNEQLQFLSNLGDRLGRTTSSMSPFYAQMYASARGTELEPNLQSGFSNLMQYGSVLGLNDESMEGAIRAVSQMIGKRQIMA